MSFFLKMLKMLLFALDKGKSLSELIEAFKFANLDDEAIFQLCEEVRKADAELYPVASKKNAYRRRIEEITETFPGDRKLCFRYVVYLTDNFPHLADAQADGTIRICSGLMDMLDDDELRFVLAHERAHIALGHSQEKLAFAWRAALAEFLIGMVPLPPLALAQQLFGGVVKELAKLHLSREKEFEADKFAVLFLVENLFDARGGISALKKLQNLSGKEESDCSDFERFVRELLETHPGIEERIERVSSIIREAEDSGAIPNPVGHLGIPSLPKLPKLPLPPLAPHQILHELPKAPKQQPRTKAPAPGATQAGPAPKQARPALNLSLPSMEQISRVVKTNLVLPKLTPSKPAPTTRSNVGYPEASVPPNEQSARHTVEKAAKALKKGFFGSGAKEKAKKEEGKEKENEKEQKS